jgi:hypothetical protein
MFSIRTVPFYRHKKNRLVPENKVPSGCIGRITGGMHPTQTVAYPRSYVLDLLYIFIKSLNEFSIIKKV